nr:ribosomal protein L37AE/L43A [Mucilaginibacter sp. X5P1]
MPLIVLTTIIPISRNTGSEKKHRRELVCPRCKNELDARIRRGFWVKTFLFWLPIKRYICYNCQRKLYKLN